MRIFGVELRTHPKNRTVQLRTEVRTSEDFSPSTRLTVFSTVN
jgi:hypothetical protein